jgi:hypothetical protein
MHLLIIYHKNSAIDLAVPEAELAIVEFNIQM